MNSENSQNKQILHGIRPALWKAAGQLRALPSTIRRWPVWVRWTATGLIVVVLAAGGLGIYRINVAKAAAASTPTLQTSVARTGDITLEASGTGTLIAASEVSLNFQSSGTVTAINVKVGDKVKKGDVIATIDSTALKTALANAKQKLLDLTDAAAIATAQEAVATDEQTLVNAQASLNNLMYKSTNLDAIQDVKSALLLAQNNLDAAQQRYDQISGDPSTNANKAAAYQQLYDAQLQYNSAAATYNNWTGTANQYTIDLKKAAVALAQAQLTEDQTLVAALTGGTIPDGATGSGYEAVIAARQAAADAQSALDAATLVAPMDGTVISLSGTVGQSSGNGTFVTIADLSQADIQIYMDQSDWANVKTGYTAQVTFDALPSAVFTGTVTEVDPALLSSGGSSVVEGMVQLDQSQAGTTGTSSSASTTSSNPIDSLPLGVSASVDVISAQAKNVVLVPIQALHQLSTDSYGVFVMVNGTPTLKVVTVGLQSDTFAEIKSGVKAGDVVTTGIQQTSSASSSTGVSNP